MKISVCKWKMCSDKFSSYILTRIMNDKKRFNLNNLIIEESECLWQCEKWPNVKVDWDIRHYVTPSKASEYVLHNNKKKKNGTL